MTNITWVFIILKFFIGFHRQGERDGEEERMSLMFPIKLVKCFGNMMSGADMLPNNIWMYVKKLTWNDDTERGPCMFAWKISSLGDKIHMPWSPANRIWISGEFRRRRVDYPYGFKWRRSLNSCRHTTSASSSHPRNVNALKWR